MRLFALIVGITGALANVAAPLCAQPAPQTEAGKLFEAGAALAAQRKYDEAAHAFKTSYDLEPNKQALFAWAQVERLAGRCAAAVDLYRTFLAQPGLTPAQNDAAVINLRRCENNPTPTIPRSASPTASTAASRTASLEPVAPERSRFAKVLAATLTGAGVASLAGATTFYWFARKDEQRASFAETWDSYYPPAQRAHRRQQIAGGLLGLGVFLSGAALVGWIATEPRHPPLRAGLAPLWGPGTFTLALQGRY